MDASGGEYFDPGLLVEESGLALGFQAWRQILQERIAVRPHSEQDLGPTLRGLIRGMCEEEVPVAGQAGALSSDAQELREGFIEQVLLAPARESRDGERSEVVLALLFARVDETTETASPAGAKKFEKALRGELDDHIQLQARLEVWRQILRERGIGAPRYESRMGAALWGLVTLLCEAQIRRDARRMGREKPPEDLLHDEAAALLERFVTEFLFFIPQASDQNSPAGYSGQLVFAFAKVAERTGDVDERRATPAGCRFFHSLLAGQLARCRGEQVRAGDRLVGNIRDRLNKQLQELTQAAENPLYVRRGRTGLDTWYSDSPSGLDADPPDRGDIEWLAAYAREFHIRRERYRLDELGDPTKLPSVFTKGDLGKLISEARARPRIFNVGTLVAALRPILVSRGLTIALEEGTKTNPDDEGEEEGAMGSLSDVISVRLEGEGKFADDAPLKPWRPPQPGEEVLAEAEREEIKAVADRVWPELGRGERRYIKGVLDGLSRQEVAKEYGLKPGKR